MVKSKSGALYWINPGHFIVPESKTVLKENKETHMCTCTHTHTHTHTHTDGYAKGTQKPIERGSKNHNNLGIKLDYNTNLKINIFESKLL
jgi:hypothetical protein